jgi:hypothetical protein
MAHGTDFSTIALSVITFSVIFSLVGAFLVDRGYIKGVGNTVLDIMERRRLAQAAPADKETASEEEIGVLPKSR